MASIPSKLWLIYKILNKLNKFTVFELIMINRYLAEELYFKREDRFDREVTKLRSWPPYTEELERLEEEEDKQLKSTPL